MHTYIHDAIDYPQMEGRLFQTREGRKAIAGEHPDE